MKKIITIIIIILIIGVIWWLSTRQESPQEEEKDVITSLLENLEQTIGIDFSEIQNVEFNWIIEVNPKVKVVNILGKGFGVERISDEQYNSVESFFKNNGFEINMYNITSGTVVGSVGYELASPGEAGGKNEIVCRIIAGVTGYKVAEGQPASPVGGWIPSELDKNDVDIECGKISNLIEIKNGDNFSIVLETNPTTGYEWQVDFDSVYLELVEQKYAPDSPELIGSGGKETFKFLAKKSGTIEITFSYLRLWEEKEPIEKKIYEIIIK